MAYNGSGTFVLVSGNPVVTGTTISSTWANNTLNDIATGLSTAITKDGQTTPTANIPMGGYKVTGAGAATTNGDLVRYEQVASLRQAQTGTYFTTGGTTTAYTLTPTPAITSLIAGQRFNVVFNAANTTTSTTLAISGLTAKTLKLYGLNGAKIDPAIGALGLNMSADVVYDGTDYVVYNVLASGAVTAAKLDGAQTGTAPIFGVRAWVNFNGTGVVAINGSGNVTSITDNGTGDYTVNFTTALPNANYAVVVTANSVARMGAEKSRATGSVTVTTQDSSTGVLNDVSSVNVIVIG